MLGASSTDYVWTRENPPVFHWKDMHPKLATVMRRFWAENIIGLFSFETAIKNAQQPMARGVGAR